MDTYDAASMMAGWAGEQPPKDVVEYPDREPDFVYEETYGLNWPLVYRLMGDGISSISTGPTPSRLALNAPSLMV